MFDTQSLIKNLAVSILSISALSACSSTMTNKDALIHGNSGAIGMLLSDSNVYLKATNRELDAVTWELLKSTRVKLDTIRVFEEQIGGSYRIEDGLLPGKLNQLCLINNFMLKHKNEFPPTIDTSSTYNWIDQKQTIYKKELTAYLGDKRMENDCRN
ncbi:hypothetical protein [Acinetobacter suaedae]|uniref:hypothetical protein n=1 Tax=Acinetobacter TaxID=469 RepID=UPI001E39299E|nr:hypothetical protein [Acinetobacter sp. C16S1]